jgi:hypothetical protein
MRFLSRLVTFSAVTTLGSAATITFDEVHHRPNSRSTNKCTLHVYRRSLFQSRTRKELLLHETRLARTPPSTFLFLPIHFSNSPGIVATPLPSRAGECRTSAHPRTVGCLITVPVRSFGGTPSRRAAACQDAVYRVEDPTKSTTNPGYFAVRHAGFVSCYLGSPGRTFKPKLTTAPYSSHIPQPS